MIVAEIEIPLIGKVIWSLTTEQAKILEEKEVWTYVWHENEYFVRSKIRRNSIFSTLGGI